MNDFPNFPFEPIKSPRLIPQISDEHFFESTMNRITERGRSMRESTILDCRDSNSDIPKIGDADFWDWWEERKKKII